jgi:hypothetical protein
LLLTAHATTAAGGRRQRRRRLPPRQGRVEAGDQGGGNSRFAGRSRHRQDIAPSPEGAERNPHDRGRHTRLDALRSATVVGTYVEALAIEVKKAGSGAPGASIQEQRVGSKPGENPAGAIGRQITVTATITAVNSQAPSVTIKGPKGNVETVKVRDAKNLANVKAGDLVEITYTQALAVALDKPTK